MTWAFTAVTVVSAGSAAYSASQSNKRARGIDQSFANAQQFALDNPGVFGQKIDFKPVEYNALFRNDPGYANIAGDTIAGNQRNLPANLQLMRDTNQAITKDAQDRINTNYPGFAAQFSQQSRNTGNLLRGDIPMEDQNAMRAQRTEQISLGGGGASQGQVAADLGLSRLQAMQSGASNLTNNVNLWNSIDPISRRVNPQSLFVDVGAAVNAAINENQFDATFGASQRDAEINYNMLPDPQLSGQLNLMMARTGAQAANPTQSVLGSAVVAGANAGLGAYNANKASQTWGQPQAQQPYYDTSVPMGGPQYASAADKSAGFQSFSGSGMGGTYNPNTGGAYAGSGALGSYFTGLGTRPTGGPKYASAADKAAGFQSFSGYGY